MSVISSERPIDFKDWQEQAFAELHSTIKRLGSIEMRTLFTACLMVASICALTPFAAQAQGQQGALPEGAGKSAVEAVCTGFHRTNEITQSSGYTRDGWKELTSTMINLSPSPDTENAILDYLAQKFPPNYNKRVAKLVSGPLEVAFKEWVMPTLGQRSRDPIQAEDGTIWWVGQFGNLMGRLDPRTGEMKEYPLPPNAFPHTIELDPNGNPWYTGNKNGSVGRLNPETGDIKLITSPVSDSKPYGIKVAADGSIWWACNGAPCLFKMDPATMELKEYKLPLGGTTVRRLDLAEDGMIWYVNSGKGRIGRLDPKTGQATEWDSPSGPRSHPYAIVVMNGGVWYNESGVRPDALVRFDIKSETFQSWPIPSGRIHAGIWRHGRSTREGNLLIHQSATNRIIQVTPRQKAASRQQT